MASLLEDPSSWRLTTSGGIPYKMVDIDMDFGAIEASGQVDVIIQSSRLGDFLDEFLPLPVQYGEIYLPQYKYYGDTALVVTKIRVMSLVDGLPIDPFGFDTNAPERTYGIALKLTLTLEHAPNGELDPGDPKTFLIITSESSGDFIHTPAASMETEDIDDEGAPIPGTKDPVRHPTIPHSVLWPQTAYNIRWNMIPYDNFQEVVLPRVKEMLGKVNSDEFDTLDQEHPETLLLLSYSQERLYSWRLGTIGQSYINLTMKIAEKLIIHDGKPHGHNSAWVPAEGWRRILINGLPTFESVEFNRIFSTTPL